MKGSRLYKVLSVMLSFMLVLSLFPTQALAEDGGSGGESTPPTIYTVIFKDSEGNILKEQQVQEGQSATAPEIPELEGYVADGWDKDFSAVMSDMTVTAVYKVAEVPGSMMTMVAPETFTVTYNANGGTGTMTDSSSPYVSGASVTVLANAFTAPANKHFSGWNTAADGSGTPYASGASFTITSNVTLYAQWIPNTLHIYIYGGNNYSNLIEHRVVYPTDAKITQYDGIEGIDLLNLLQSDYGNLAGKSGAFSSSEIYSNGQIDLVAGANYTYSVTAFVKKDSIETSYTVKGYDEFGAEIYSNTVNSSHSNRLDVGDSVNVNAPSISGYTLTSSSPVQLILKYSNNVANFYYSHKYYITYDRNGGSGTMTDSSNPYYYGETFTAKTNTFSPPSGKYFTGWNTAANGSGTSYSAGATGTITGDVKLYAQWAFVTYSVTYNANGGSGTMTDPNSPYNSGSSFTVLANAFTAPANKHFTGWNSKSDGTGTNYNVGSSYTISSKRTLYAQWALNLQYTVIYNANGGSGTMTDTNSPYYEGNSFTVMSNTFTAPSGKSFSGWNTAANGSGTSYTAGTSYTISANVKLYAQWSYIDYTISYVLNGGINASGNPTSYKITDLPITPAPATRAGYSFNGWSPANIPVGSTGNKTFTASWTLIVYDITYELNGGVNASGNPSKYTVETPTFTLEDPTKEGYNFVRWEPADATIEQGTTGDLHFEAIWSDAVEYNITYNLDGGVNGANPSTYTIESGLITLADPTKDGYNFTGWTPTNNIPAGSTGDKEFTATWSDPIVYNIVYNLNGGVNGANPSTYTVESGLITLENPTKDGYTFNGWAPTHNIPAGSTGDKAFTATWSAPIAYNITYVMNGGTNDASNPSTYTVESGLITLANPTKAGYNFLGWTPTDNIPAGSTGDIEFTATWSDAIVYNITYNLNGGANDASNPATYTVESGLITLANPTKAGYNFLGWTPTDNIPAGSTGDQEFTATWSDAIVYNITYDLAGGVNNGSNPSTYTVNSATINLLAPTKAGYSFNGWTPASSIPSGSTGNKSFTATWSAPIDYTITYVLGGGTNAPTNPSTYNVTSSTITLAAPTRLGYNFLGWNPTGVINTGSTGNKTFTARWSAPIRYNITYTMNGGNNSLLNPSSYTVNSGTITLRDPWRIGYDFAGWTPTNSIPSGSTGDKAFTASWTPVVYTIHYYMNGGTNNAANPATYTVETPNINLATPTRAGYDFWFWFPLSSIPQGSVGDRYVWAIWKAPTNYSITYNLNGGTNNPANPSMYNVESSTINLADPTRDGYTFAGWTPTDNIPAGSTGNKEFTASWTAIDYTITYNLGGGTNAAGNPATYTIETPTFTLGDPTRDYYTFNGWTPSDTTIEQGSPGDLTFTASWTPITYNITYVLGGGTNDAANPATYNTETATFTLADPTRPGYNFLGWDPADDTIEVGSHGDLTFTATWSDPIVYTVTYALGGGVNAPTNPATYTVESPLITLAAPTRLGYNFVSWAPGATIPAGSTGDKLFTATWSDPIVYPITYVMNGGANAAANPATYTIESPTITLLAPAQAGYVFLGWTPAGVIPTGSTGPLTFTANWSAPIVYDITYVLGGGTNAAGNPGTYTVESPTITLAAATRVGYDFLGWTPAGTIPAGSTGDVTFTARWSNPHVHTVTYFVTGGTDTGLDGATPYRVYTNVAYGSVVPVPGNPAQDNYTFDGWTTAIPVNMPDADVVIYGSLTQLPAPQEIITNERTPLAGPTWSLLNLILTALTVISIGTILSIFQKKRENKSTKKNTAFSLSTLLPAAGVIVAFIMTQVLSGTMVFTDRWSYLFAGITLVQAVVVAMALTGKPKKV